MMRDYAVNDYGLLMNEEMLKLIASKYCADYTEENYEEDSEPYKDELWDAGLCERISEFTGESISINDEGVDDWGGESEFYDSDMLYYIPIGRSSTLFRAAYRNIEQLINEFKDSIGEYLPEDFDYRSKIRHFCGTYYG